MSTDDKKSKLKPLKITCTSTNCANGLHFFRPSRDMRGTEAEGACRECGADLVEWDRIRQCDPEDTDHTFANLQHELIRHYYWHVEIPQRVRNYALRKGWQGLREAVPARMRNSVGKAADSYDGRQTPVETSKGVNAIHYAQHATATCCRKCIHDWYGIPVDRALTDAEANFLSTLALRYLQVRFPEVTETPRRVPRIRNAS